MVEACEQSSSNNLSWCSPSPSPVSRIGNPTPPPALCVTVYYLVLDVGKSTPSPKYGTVQKEILVWCVAPPPCPPSWSSLMPLVHRVSQLCPTGLSFSCAPQVPSPEASRSTRVTVAVVDTFVWQALASVAIPGFTINRVCAASLYVLGTATRWPLAVRKWTTTALGLLVIPVIIHPIDRWALLPASGSIHYVGGDEP